MVSEEKMLFSKSKKYERKMIVKKIFIAIIMLALTLSLCIIHSSANTIVMTFDDRYLTADLLPTDSFVYTGTCTGLYKVIKGVNQPYSTWKVWFVAMYQDNNGNFVEDQGARVLVSKGSELDETMTTYFSTDKTWKLMIHPRGYNTGCTASGGIRNRNN